MTEENVCGKRIAILGATSHIAMGVIHQFCGSNDLELYLFARSSEKLHAWLHSSGCAGKKTITVLPFDDFLKHRYDTVINCVGVGSPGKLAQDPLCVFHLTEQFDELVLGYLKQEASSLYLSLSSGAAYGTDFSEPASEDTPARFHANGISPSEYYGIAKLHCEAKHRALKDLNIVDLRVFGYFSRFIDLGERYLLSELMSCLKSGEEFVTGPQDIVRDFVHPEDLAALVRCLMTEGRINDVLDVYSTSPAGKFEILEHFAASGALKYRVDGGYAALNTTGAKNNYFSLNRRAERVGYRPRYSSLECIIKETEAIVSAQLCELGAGACDAPCRTDGP